MPDNFDIKLEKYAEFAVKTWLNVQPGQRLLILSPLEGAPLVRLISKCAYQNGSPFVNIFWTDSESTRIRFQYAPRDSWNETVAEYSDATKTILQRGDALLSISAQDPDLLRGLDNEFIARAQKVYSQQARPISEMVMRNEIAWLGIGMPVPAWAMRVFPNVPEELAVAQLWDAIFRVCRVDTPDPAAAWDKHIADLAARRQLLDAKQFSALHYSGEGTDLTVGLVTDHVWIGGREETKSGIPFIANVPTEEVFTMPHREQVTGVVTSTKPLPVRGVVIEKFTLTFENGRVVKLEASNAGEVLEQMLKTDESAARLGEVALVPHSSPISGTGLLFYNALFDENAASHFALGGAYPGTARGTENLTPEELTARGMNDSLIHLDFMVGSGEIKIDGIYADGTREPVMRNGEWAFYV